MTHYLIGMAQAAAGGSGSGLMQMAPLVLIFVVFYVLVIRPQSKKAKELQSMLKELKKGDDVVTQGGVIGRITGIKEAVTRSRCRCRRACACASSAARSPVCAIGRSRPRSRRRSRESPKDVKAS